MCNIPVDTHRRFDVRTTLFDRYGRWMDVKATSCACWDTASMEHFTFYKPESLRTPPMYQEIWRYGVNKH